jgi:iron complex outermembrane receptor protein
VKRRALALSVFAVAFALSEARARGQDQPAPPPAAPPAPAPFSTTVTGPSLAPTTPREDSAAAATVILPAETPRAYDDLGTMLLEVPGVSVARTGSPVAFTSVTLRGSNPDEVLVYVDGVPLNLAEGGGVDISTLPLGDVERVEVYRGTTPLAFGESALGGVISIVTRTPGRTGALLRAGVGSFGTFFGDATAGGRAGRLRFYVGAHVYATTGDYPYLHPPPAGDPNPNLVEDLRENNDAFQGNGAMRLAATLRGRRTLTLGLIGFGRVQGLPKQLLNQPTMAARFHTLRGLGYLRYESRDDLGPGGRLSAQFFTSLERDRLLDPDGEVSARGPTTAHDTTVSTGVSAFGSRPLEDWGRASVVLEGRRETYTSLDETAPSLSSLPARRLVGVGGGELDVRWPAIDLRLIPSVRLEAISDLVTGINPAGRPQPAGPAVTHFLPVYRLGVVRPLGETATFKANVGRYARAPSFLELYGSGDARLLGNPALLPEHGENADLAVWIDRAGSRVAVVSRTTLFGALADDLIYWLRTAGGPSRAENLSAARVYGVEQELRLAFGRHVRVVGQGTYTVALDESGASASQGKQIPQHPRVTGYVRPELTHLALPAGIELGAYADAALRAGSYADPANLEPYATQVLFGAGVTALVPRAHLRATLSALNLTDLSTFDVLSWPLPGRTVLLALAYEPLGGGADEWGGSGFSGFGYP